MRRALILAAVLVGALAAGGTALADDTTTPPTPEAELFGALAENSFTEYLNNEYAEFSEGPYCSVSHDFQTASCQALIDGVISPFVGTLYSDQSGYGSWRTPEQVAAAEAIDAATSPEEAFTIDAEAEGHTLTGVECAIHEQPNVWTEYACHGTTDDPDDDDATVRWAGTVADFGDKDYSVTSDIVDDLLVSGYVYSIPDVEDTALVSAAQECIDLHGGDYGEYSFELADRGHSVGVSDEDVIECLLGVLGLPTWTVHAVITAPLFFDGFGMMTGLGNDGGSGGLIIFDDTVAPQH